MATHVNDRIKKVLLINPPAKIYLYPDGSPAHRKHCTPPLGLAYLAANMRKHGYAPAILDCVAEGYYDEEIRDSFLYYGLRWESIRDQVAGENPDLIGVSVLFSNLISDVFEMCARLKQAFPDIPIILGGHHPTGAPVDCMKNPHIDYVMLGESDQSFVTFLESLNGRIPINETPTLYYKEDGEIKNTMNKANPAYKGVGYNYYYRKDAGIPLHLDDLPFPAWDLLPMEKYWKTEVRIGGGDVIGERYAVMVSTRGCPHVCNFCTSPLVSGYKGYRMRDNDEVVREIRWLVDTYGVTEVQFMDDNFNVSAPRAKRLMRQLGREFPDVVFSATGGTEVNALDDEMIDLMAQSNFYKVLLAIEAADQDLQNLTIDKKVKVHRVPEIVRKLREKGIETRALFMIGFPGETRNSIQKTVDLARTLDVDDFYISIVTPMPGTPLYDECIEKGLFVKDFDVNNIRFSTTNIRLPDTTGEELETIRRTVWHEAFEERRQRVNSHVTNRHHRFSETKEYETIGFRTLNGTETVPVDRAVWRQK